MGKDWRRMGVPSWQGKDATIMLKYKPVPAKLIRQSYAGVGLDRARSGRWSSWCDRTRGERSCAKVETLESSDRCSCSTNTMLYSLALLVHTGVDVPFSELEPWNRTVMRRLCATDHSGRVVRKCQAAKRIQASQRLTWHVSAQLRAVNRGDLRDQR